jgi:dipeptidyl-peptidase-4
MNMNLRLRLLAAAIVLLLVSGFRTANAQFENMHWAADGYHYYFLKGDSILEYDTRSKVNKTVILTPDMATPAGQSPLKVDKFSITSDGKRILLFANTQKVWRYNTRGDYWLYVLAPKP